MHKLLIVDDEDIIRNGLLSIPWEEKGFRVVNSVADGFSALEILESELIDIVITDIRMPGMNGLELAEFIQKHNIMTKVILLSGYSDFEDARNAIQSDVVEYLLKPSSPEEILDAVDRAKSLIDDRKKRDLRIRMLEAELGKRQLVFREDGYILGEMEYSDITSRVFGYIKQNYSKYVSLSTLSSELHYSSVYLSKIIKKDTEYTFLELLNAYRSHMAAKQLRETNKTITEICEEIGIIDPRYFGQVFKKYFAIPPGQYKKNPGLLTDKKLECLVLLINGEKV
jgi:two-component system, response regulator YesN